MLWKRRLPNVMLIATIAMHIMAMTITFMLLQSGYIYETNIIQAFFLNGGYIITLAEIGIYWAAIYLLIKRVFPRFMPLSPIKIQSIFIATMFPLVIFDLSNNISFLFRFINQGGIIIL